MPDPLAEGFPGNLRFVELYGSAAQDLPTLQQRLAISVLQGDLDAAHALADLIQEQRGQPGTT